MVMKSLKTVSDKSIIVANWTETMIVKKEITFSSEHLSDECIKELSLCAQEGYFNTNRPLSCDDIELTFTEEHNTPIFRMKVPYRVQYPNGIGFKELDALLDLARKNDCDWLVIREDYPVNINLPIYD